MSGHGKLESSEGVHDSMSGWAVGAMQGSAGSVSGAIGMSSGALRYTIKFKANTLLYGDATR